MKKILWGSVFVFLVLFTGCGKVSREVRDISAETETVISEPVYEQAQVNFVSTVRALLSGQTGSLQKMELEKTNSVFNLANTNKLAAIDQNYLYWNYEAVTVNNGNITEAYLGQYRYYDKRTGLPFNKLENYFNQEDVNNIDYIERYLQTKGFYAQQPYDPQKFVYKITYHEKIQPHGATYTITLYPDNDSKMEYIGWPWSKLIVKNRTVEYDPRTKSGDGTMQVVADSPYSEFHFDFIGGVIENKMRGDCNIYSNTNLIANLKIVGQSQNAETIYYLGKNFFYNSLTALNGGIEDHSTVEFQDNQKYSETTIIDGSANLSATTPERLQTVVITSKTGLSSYPELTSLLTIKKVDGLKIEKLLYRRKGIRLMDCSKVTINGSYYEYITDTTFKN